VDSYWQLLTLPLLFVWDTVDFLAATQSLYYVKSKFFWCYYLTRAFAILLVSYGLSVLSLIQLPQAPLSGLWKAIVMSAVGVTMLQNVIIRIGQEKFDLEGKWSLIRSRAINDVTTLSLEGRLRQIYKVASSLATTFSLDELKREKRSWLELKHEPATARAKLQEYLEFYDQLEEDDQKRGFAIRLVQEAGIDYARKLVQNR